MCKEIKDRAKSLIIALKLKNQKIAFAESISGGMFAKAITDTAGASRVFECSVVAYSEKIKKSVLKVSERTIADCGVVSEPVAAQMAIGVQNLSGADLAVSCTGEAGPVSSTDVPVGTVCVGVFYRGMVKTKTFNFDEALSRNEIRKELTVSMLDFVLGIIK